MLQNDYAELISEKDSCLLPGKRIKLLTPKQIFQRLPIVLAQVKAVNTSKNLPNEIRQKLYFFCIKEKKLLKRSITI